MAGVCAMLKVPLIILCFATLTSGSGGKGITAEDCLQPADEGPCRARIPSYYYDRYTQSCRQFIYGGCEGNRNNFETRAACDRACGNDEKRRRELAEKQERLQNERRKKRDLDKRRKRRHLADRRDRMLEK